MRSHLSVGGTFTNPSDERIKKNITDLNDNESLNLINQLDVKKYKYIDESTRGNVETYGFLAQQVESIIPLAVKTSEKHIPTVYETSNISTSNGEVIVTLNNSIDLTDSTIYGNISSPLNFKYYDNNNLALDLDTTSIDSTHLQIDGATIVSGNLCINNEVKGNISNGQIFVVGPKVNDFKSLDKSKIFSVGISAIQDLNSKYTTLQTQYNDLLTRVTALENA